MSSYNLAEEKEKFKTVQLAGKVMVIVAWDAEDIIG